MPGYKTKVTLPEFCSETYDRRQTATHRKYIDIASAKTVKVSFGLGYDGVFVAQFCEMDLEITVIITILYLEIGVTLLFQNCNQSVVFFFLKLDVYIVVPGYEFAKMAHTA